MKSFAFIALCIMLFSQSCTKPAIEEESHSELPTAAKPPATSPSHTFDWKKCFGGTADEAGRAVAKGILGYMVVGQIGFSDDGYVGFYNPLIKQVKQGIVGGSRFDQLRGVVSTPDGGFLAVGNTNSPEIDGYDEPSTVNNLGTVVYPYELLFVKYSSAGDEEWRKIFRKEGSQTTLAAINTSDGGIAVTAFSGPQLLFFKFSSEVFTNPQAALQWEASCSVSSGSSNFGYALLEVTPTEFVVAGNCVVNSVGGVLVVRIQQGIAPEPKRIAAPTGSSLGFGIATNEAKTEFVITGRNDEALLVLKLNNELIETSRKTYGGTGSETGHAIVKSANGYLIVGTTNSKNGDVIGAKGSNDIWVLQLRDDLTISRSAVMGGNRDDDGRGVILDKMGESEAFTLVGTTNSTGGDISGKAGGSDMWAAKFKFN
jgi:hypothetical protein